MKTMTEAEFMEMWNLVALTHKSRGEVALPDGGADADPASPEVINFLESIARATPEELGRLLGFSTPEPTTKWPPAAQKALCELYAKFGNNQTRAQKLHILETILGGRPCISTTPPVQSEDDEEALRLAVEEHEYLANIGAIELELR